MFHLPRIPTMSSSDRFIPKRANIDFEFSYHLIDTNIPNNQSQLEIDPKEFKVSDIGVVNTGKYMYYRKNYNTILKKSIFPNKDRVLEFSSPKKKRSQKTEKKLLSTSWPVEARKKPLLDTPSIVLDMPDLNTLLCKQVVDWGKNGYIAAIFEGEVHLWHPTKLKRHVTQTERTVGNCVIWNNAGTHFAVSLVGKGIVVFDDKAEKELWETSCVCICDCSVTALTWTSSNCLITGCCIGRLCWWSPELRLITSIIAHEQDIIKMKLSSAEYNLVTCGLEGKVKIWTWPDLKENFEIKFDIPIKAVDWHPWRDPLLVIGDPNYITIWNVKTQKKVDSSEHHNVSTIYVDCLSFNPVSGELLGSYLCSDTDEVSCLKVHKTLDCVVDSIQFKFGRIPYLLWDSTGTKLATAGSDENLCIWDFFGTATLTEKKFLRKRKRILTTNMFKSLEMLGGIIR